MQLCVVNVCGKCVWLEIFQTNYPIENIGNFYLLG